MGLKSFMLIVLAIFLAITSEVAGRKLSQSSTTSPDKGHANEATDAKFQESEDFQYQEFRESENFQDQEFRKLEYFQDQD
ncbi:hypothetical protein P3L10_011609 [Capsicum annuum]